MSLRNAHHHRTFHGFTLVEVLVVIGVIVALLGVLFPALSNARKTGLMATSMSNMRQIGFMMRSYSQENRDHIVPSQFDYSPPEFTYKGKVRTALSSTAIGKENEGTWADILWTENNLGGELIADSNYRFDSPDKAFHDSTPDFTNPLRSALANSHDFLSPSGSIPANPVYTPFGDGAQESSLPGFFAANDFFNARPQLQNPEGVLSVTYDSGGTCTVETQVTPETGWWFTTGQIKVPARSMYLVDSLAGETISYDPTDVCGSSSAYDTVIGPGDVYSTTEVDFRYNDACLMLFLDGHVDQQAPWKDLVVLESKRHIKVAGLTRN